MAFDVEGALKAGYSEREVAEFLGQQRKFDTSAALAAGYSPRDIIGHLSAAPAPAPFSAKDVALSVGQGALGGVKALTDVFGAGNVASQALERGQRAMGEAMTPERQAELAAQEQRAKEAEKEGVGAEITAALKNIKEAPLQSTAQAVGSFLPFAATSLVGAAAKLLPATMRAINVVVGAAQGAGAVKGSIYDAVKDKLISEGMPEELADKQAKAAQEYTGKNIGQIGLGTALGGVSGGVGIENLLTKAGAKAAPAGLTKRVGHAIAAEAPTEAAQGGQERMAANIALQKEGYNVPTFQGVAGQATSEGVMGALAAGPVAAVRGPGAAQAQPPGAPAPAPAPAAPAAPTAPQIDLNKPYGELVQQREQLRAQEQTPEVKAMLGQLTQRLRQMDAEEVQNIRTQRAQEQADAQKAAQSAFAAQQPQQMEIREAMPQGQLPPQTDLFGKPIQRPEEAFPEPQLRPREQTIQDKREAREAGQQRIPFRYTKEGEPTSTTAPPAPRIYMPDLEAIGIPFKTAKDWFNRNVVNRTKEQVADLVRQDPTLVKGQGSRAKILRTLLGPEVPTFEEPARGKPPVTRAPIEPGTDQRGLGVPSTPPVAGGAPTAPAAAPQKPVVAGLAGATQPAGAGVEGKGQQPPALTPQQIQAKAVSDAQAAIAARKKGTPSAPPAVTPTTPAAAPVAQKPAPVAPSAPVTPPTLAAPRPLATIQAELDSLRNQQSSLKLKSGKLPMPNSPARKKYDELESKVKSLMPEYDRASEANRKREEEDTKRRMAEQQKKTAAQVRKAPEALPPAERKPTPPIPEEMREPIGVSTYGMPEGEVEIRRGPQAELFPSGKAETRKRAEAADKRRAELEAEPEPTAPQAKTDKGQMELDFTTKPAAEEVIPETDVLSAIENRPMIEVAQWAADNLYDPDQALIASRVVTKLKELESLGIELAPIQVTPSGKELASGALGTTGYERGKNGALSRVRIILNHPSNGDRAGTSPEILLHELIHAATFGSIELGRLNSAKGTKLGTVTTDLYALANAVIQHYNNRVTTGATLTPFEQQIRGGQNNALRDAHEVLTWGLTNRSMQEYMESIPYKGQTAWNKFVTFVRDLLGIPAKADTALSEILRVADTLLDLKATDIRGAEKVSGQKFAVSYSTERLVDSMGPIDNEQRNALTDMIKGVKGTAGDPDLVTRFRTMMTDSAAAMEQKVQKHFNGAVRDSLGKLNPMGLFRQAQDYTKLLLEYFDRGALVKDPDTGLWKVSDKEGVAAPTKVFSALDDWSAKNGYSRERGTQIASRILEGVRLDAMRTANKTQGTSFLLHLKDAEIDQLVAEYKADPDLKAISDLMDRARIDMVDNMVKVGRLSAEQGKAWKEVAGYVPFDRLDDFTTSFAKVKKVSGKGIAQVGKLPELVGSINRPVGNVFENYLNTLGWMVRQVTNTDATRTTLKALEDLGFAKPLGTSTQHKDNTVGAYVNGELRYWQLPSSYDVLAFKDLTVPKTGLVRFLGEFSNILRKTVTSLPPFALKQVADDIQRAIFTSGVKNPGPMIRMALTNFPKIALAELRGIKHPIVRDFGALGLTGEYDFQQGRPADSLLKDIGFKKRGRFETILHKLDAVTRASDLAVRKAIYDQTLRENNDALLAQTRAREFINFRRRGASNLASVMTTTIPFFNAYAQGMDVLYRAATGEAASSGLERNAARKLFWSRAAMLTAFATMYALAKSDDDDYKEMDLRTRDGNWILGGGLKIGVPSELGAIFKVIPERVVEYYKRQGTPEEQEAFEAVRTAMAYIGEQYVGRMVPVPQAAKPLLEAFTNFSFLTGRPLEGIFQKTQMPSARRAAGTSELAIKIAEFSRDMVGVEVSPIMIDNTLRGYFGSTAAMVTMTTDSLLNPTRVDRPLHKYALLSNYLYDPVGTRRVSEFYEERDKVGQLGATLRELAKTDPDKAEAFAEKHQDGLAMEKSINATLQQLEHTRAYRKYLNSPIGAKEMSAAERESELEELRRVEVDIVSWLREAKTEIRRNPLSG